MWILGEAFLRRDAVEGEREGREGGAGESRLRRRSCRSRGTERRMQTLVLFLSWFNSMNLLNSKTWSQVVELGLRQCARRLRNYFQQISFGLFQTFLV